MPSKIMGDGNLQEIDALCLQSVWVMLISERVSHCSRIFQESDSLCFPSVCVMLTSRRVTHWDFNQYGWRQAPGEWLIVLSIIMGDVNLQKSESLCLLLVWVMLTFSKVNIVHSINIWDLDLQESGSLCLTSVCVKLTSLILSQCAFHRYGWC